MIRSYSIKNFQSFLELSKVSFDVGGHCPDDDRVFTSPAGARISKAVAIVGPNASGKTTLIKAMAFMSWFTRDSFTHLKPDEPIPVAPHFAQPGAASEFELVFEMDEAIWRYRLAVIRERVLSESLHTKKAHSFTAVFTRRWNDEGKAYAVKQKLDLQPREAAKVRENASLISTAAQYDSPLAKRLLAMNVFTNVTDWGRRVMDDDQILMSSAFYAGNEELRTTMAKLLADWDLGLTDVRVEKTQIPNPSAEMREVYLPFGIHRIGDVEHKLMMRQESSGTQGAFLLLTRILPALKFGGLVVIDELEADLHPHLLEPILDLFFSQRTNPCNAQILFTCHSMEIFRLLTKYQIILVEKDTACQSEAWRLDDVKGVRPDENLYAKYMAGAYGATPNL